MALSKEFCLAICFLFIILTCQAGQTSDGHAFAPSSGLSTDLAAARDLVATNQLIYGPDHTNTAAAIENLAEIYIQNGQYAEAQPLCGQSVQIRESFTNTDPAKLLKAMVMLAGVYNHVGDYENAMLSYQRIEKIALSSYGSENLITAKANLFLGNAYLNLCDYANAGPLFQESLASFSRILGPENQFSAAAISGLANMNFALGNYSKAEPYYRECLKLCEETLGHDNPETARALNNLAFLYLKLNDLSKAEPIFLDSLKIMEAASGQDHPDLIDPLNNLANIYYEQRDYAKTEPLLRRCLEISKGSFGPKSPNTARALNNLAEFYQDTGDLTNAENSLLQSLNIYKTALREDHPDTAVILFNLAGIYCRKGDYAGAEPIYKHALKIQEEAYGQNYPDKASDYRFLETLLIDLGKTAEARGCEVEANAARQLEMNNVFSFTTEQERMAFQSSQSPYDLLAFFGNAQDLAEALFRYKGVVLDSILEDDKDAELSKNPDIKRIREALLPAGRRLVQMQTELPNEITEIQLKRYRESVDKLQAEVDQLQEELARNASGLGPVRRALRVTVPEVKAALGDNSTLIEFVRYSYYLGTNFWESRYGAIVIDHTNLPVWMPLGNATNIEQNLREYEQTMRGEKRGDPAILKTLYAELVDPILETLPANVSTLIISPDSELNFLSFATLVNGQDQFLAERYQIKYVSSGRDLVYGRTATNVNPELAVFADPEFNKTRGPVATKATDLTMLSSDMRDYNGISLPRLPNTAQEAAYLTANSPAWHLRANTFTGTSATEAQVKALHSPYILHLATHGFFLPDTETTNPPKNLSINQKMPVILHNPMQRSGLALAGAQLTLDSWQKGEVPDTENDGILMADEVAMLDLHNTWLVTLSACDTGIGEARVGEGVLGLRRGFIQAGAQNLLMTLWPVSDRSTVNLMEAFYDKAMKTGDAPSALADVQRDFLVKLKKEKSLVMAARLAGPFVMNFQGKPGSN